ncbi:MAG: IMP cyclohydrolase [Candidatus Aminicenantales bacterium]
MRTRNFQFPQVEYPGRIILIGLDPGGRDVVVVYAVTGRSPSSQARRMDLQEDTVWMRPTNEELLSRGHVDLLVYPCIIVHPSGIAVSNGRQTVDILAGLGQGADPAETLAFALKEWEYEPDAPHYTPRISGCVLAGKKAALSLIKRDPDGSCLRSIHAFSLSPGRGKMIMTYRGENREPLPPFSGEPIDVGVSGGTPQEVAERVYTALGPMKGRKDYRVAVACVFCSDFAHKKFQGAILNRIERTGS